MPAGPGDLPVVTTVLARAFFRDPLFCWLLPDSRRRIWQLNAFFCAEFPRYRACFTANRSSAALWNPPGAGGSHTIELLRHLAVALCVTGRYIGRLARTAHLLEARSPKEPHWYLHSVGTLPEAREPFLGALLVRAMLDQADAAGQPAYLESTSPQNRRFYAHFGFEPLPDLALAHGPVIFPMWRAPRTG